MAAHRSDTTVRNTPWTTLRRWLPAVLATGLGGTAFAEEPKKTETPGLTAKPDLKADAPKTDAKPEKLFEVKFDKKEWSQVFDWLEVESGLQFISKDIPTGTCTLKGLPGKKYNLGELIDLFNEVLEKNKFIIIRKNQSFSVYPADEGVPADWVQTVASREELNKRGKTEVVRMIVPLVTLNADDILPQVKVFKSQFGTVSTFGTDKLLIMDKADKIRLVLSVIDDIVKDKADQHNHRCKFKRATYVADQLRGLLKDGTTEVNSGQGTAAQVQQPSWGGGGWGGDRGQWGGGGQPMQPNQVRPDAKRFRNVNIAVDDAQNSLFITGPADKIIAAKDLLEKLDTGEKERPAPGPAAWKTYNVANGTAEALAKTLMARAEYKNSNIQTLASGTSQVMVYAYAADHVEIEKLLEIPTTKSTVEVKIVPVNLSGEALTALAATVVKSIGGGITVDPKVDGEAGLVLRGTPEQIKAAEELVKAIAGVQSFGGSDKIRTLTIEKANAGVLAEAIVEMGRKMGKSYQVVDPNRPPEAPKKPAEPAPKGPPGSSSLDYRGNLRASTQIVDPLKKTDVTITVIGNKLIITGDDPKEVQLAYELMSLYTTGAGDKAQERYEVLRLKNVGSDEAAKLITEIFNGPTQAQSNQRNQGGGGLNPFALLQGLTGAGGSAPNDPKKDRVKVVAEKGSNSLIIVRASELDVLTIKDLLKRSIDSNDPPEGGLPKTWIIRLENASASAMVTTIRTVYAAQTGRNNRTGGGGANPFNPFAQQAAAPAQQASLAVDYDVDTNQVILNCNEGLYKEIKVLCDSLDKTTKETESVTEVVKLTGIAPSQVQQFIEALQGKTPVVANNGFGGQGQGGRGGQGGGGFGGLGGGQGGGGFGGLGGGGFGGLGGGGFGGMGGQGGGGFGGVGGGRGGAGGGLGGGGQGGGGARPGGGGGGGGARPGGGGGRPQRSPDRSGDGGGGQRPFDYPGMDARSAPLLFDPEVDELELGYLAMNGPGPRKSAIVQAAFYEPYAGTTSFSSIQRHDDLDLQPVPAVQPPKPVPGGTTQPTPMQPGGIPPAKPIVVETPDSATKVIALDQLGTITIIGKNKAEVEKIKRIIELLLTGTNIARDVEVAIEIVPLKKADATVVVNELQLIFARLQLQPGSLSFPQPVARQGGGGGFGGQGGGFGAQNVQAQGTAIGNIVLFAIPRFNSILVAVPKSSMEVVKKQIAMFDLGTATSLDPVRYPLTRASANIVQRQILDLFLSRFPGDVSDKIRVTVDSSNNAVIVQAGPSDQEEIGRLIKLLDMDHGDGPVNDVKVFRLKNAFADDLANTINSALTANVLNPQQSTVSSQGSTTGQLGGGGQAGGITGQQGNAQLGTGAGNQQQQGGLGGRAQSTLTGITQGVTTKTMSLRFNSKEGTFESGQFEDVHISYDLRMNAVIVAAPKKTMLLIEALVKELDGVAAAKSYVNIFQLKKADATAVQTLLISLFSRQTQAGGGGGGGGGQLGGLGGANTAQGTTRPLLTLTGDPADGASLIDLRLTADTRTNSLIVAGSQNDLDLVRAVIAKLEDATAPQFLSDVIKLKNAAAADVSAALTTFLAAQLSQVATVQGTTGNAYNSLQRQFNITPEPVTNQLLISATPQLMPEILRLIQTVDAAPPQVQVEVLIAEVRLNNTEEFGVEFGLQSDVLFSRGGATPTVPGTPGYNFNTTSALGNTANVNPSQVGFSGLGNLGVGRVGASGLSGFVLSAASDSFSLLIRALKAQGRVDVLSRPVLTLADNQVGFFQVGQRFPQITGTTISAQGFAQNTIQYADIGVVLRVTPRISPDGQVLMRVEPQVSGVSATQVQISPGVFASAIDTQTVETTVLASDGETVVLGGLIRKADTKSENKIPILGDLPWVGAAFRYRSQTQERREVVFIMTPRIARTKEDLRKLFAAEAKKMSWSINDVTNVTALPADRIRGKETDANCLDGITGPAPTYLPYSPSTVITSAPMYSAPTSSAIPLVGPPQLYAMPAQSQPAAVPYPGTVPAPTPAVNPVQYAMPVPRPTAPGTK